MSNKNNGHDGNEYTDYDPVFRELLHDALGFDALNVENYDVKVRKIVLNNDDTDGSDHITASFHLMHLNLVARMDLFDNTVGGDDADIGDSDDIVSKYGRFFETLHNVPAFAQPVGTSRMFFDGGRYFDFATVWPNEVFFDDNKAIAVTNRGNDGSIDSVIMPSLYALHRTDVAGNKVLTKNTVSITEKLRAKVEFLSQQAAESLKAQADERIREMILAGRQEAGSGNDADSAREQSLLQEWYGRKLEEVDNLHLKIMGYVHHIEHITTAADNGDQSASLLSSDTVLLYDNLDKALFGRERGRIGNIGANVYRGPAIVDLAYTYHLIGRDYELMRLALTEYGVRSRAISQELNGELLSEVHELSKVFVLLEELSEINSSQ